MKLIVKLIALFLSLIPMLTSCSSVLRYDNRIAKILHDDGVSAFIIVDSSSVTEENFENLVKPVVTRDVGIVTTPDGDGRLVNAPAPYNYISYAGLGFSEGEKVVTYCLLGNSYDDIIVRYDFVME